MSRASRTAFRWIGARRCASSSSWKNRLQATGYRLQGRDRALAQGGAPMRDHDKLKVFHVADRLVIEVYRLTQQFPRHEAFGLVSQMRRSATSVACNIVEGSTRRSQSDYVRFLELSLG